jgi:hypothetical protein
MDADISDKSCVDLNRTILVAVLRDFEPFESIVSKVSKSRVDASDEVRRGLRSLLEDGQITTPAWRSWNRAHLLVDIAFYSVRFLLLLLAIVIAFRHPQEISSRLGALLLASGAVAEGYPSSGWAASLHQLPLPFAILVCLAVSFCLLGPALWLAFFATYPQRWFGRCSLRRLLLLVLVFAVPIMVSALAVVYAPGLLARDWPAALSAAPARLIQDAFGVSPLLFLSVLPLQSSILQIAILELWLIVSVAYFAAGILLLLKASLRLENPLERRRFGFLSASVAVFAWSSLTMFWCETGLDGSERFHLCCFRKPL